MSKPKITRKALQKLVEVATDDLSVTVRLPRKHIPNDRARSEVEETIKNYLLDQIDWLALDSDAGDTLGKYYDVEEDAGE